MAQTAPWGEKWPPSNGRGSKPSTFARARRTARAHLPGEIDQRDVFGCRAANFRSCRSGGRSASSSACASASVQLVEAGRHRSAPGSRSRRGHRVRTSWRSTLSMLLLHLPLPRRRAGPQGAAPHLEVGALPGAQPRARRRAGRARRAPQRASARSGQSRSEFGGAGIVAGRRSHRSRCRTRSPRSASTFEPGGLADRPRARARGCTRPSRRRARPAARGSFGNARRSAQVLHRTLGLADGLASGRRARGTGPTRRRRTSAASSRPRSRRGASRTTSTDARRERPSAGVGRRSPRKLPRRIGRSTR